MNRLLAGLVAILLLSSPLCAQEGGFKKRVAFLVGVNEYDKPDFGQLGYAERDVEELAKVFKDILKFDEVVLLKGKDATRQGIETKLTKLVKTLGRSDLCVVALSGHGLQFEIVEGKEEAYFCPVDAVCPRRNVPTGPKNQGDNLYSMKELTGVLRQNAGTNLLLVDACRNEPPLDGKGAKGLEGVDDYPVEQRMAIFFSCSARQRAWENKNAGGGHSVFTWCVLEGLRGGAKDSDGDITWLGLVKYVDKAMKKDETKAWLGKPQEPALSSKVSKDVLLAKLEGGTKIDPKVEMKDDPEVIRFKVGMETFEMKFAKIPGGTFKMGSSKEALALVKKKFGYELEDEDEHEVEVSPFLMGKFHVTRGQFGLFVKDEGYKTEAEEGGGAYGWNQEKKDWETNKDYNWKNVGFTQSDAHPVVCVTWNDAKKFCAWLSKKSGKKIGLPSEAQWEYACRAGSKTLYFFGDDEEDLSKYGNVRDASFRKATTFTNGIQADDGYAFTSPVGTFKANKYGLYDMHGNAWQWCEDYYGAYSAAPKNGTAQKVKQSNDVRVLRGGSWYYVPQYCRSAFRILNSPVNRNYNLGFRVASSPQD